MHPMVDGIGEKQKAPSGATVGFALVMLMGVAEGLLFGWLIWG